MLAEIEPYWKAMIEEPFPDEVYSEGQNIVPSMPNWLEFLSDPSIPFDERLDRWDSFALRYPQVELPLEHIFTEGLYVRKIFMPAGTIVTSRKHKEQHPFTVLRGRVTVISETEGGVEYEGPFLGVTPPGTRRALYIHEDTEWVTFHRNPDGKTDPDELVGDLTFDYVNPYLTPAQLEDLKR